MLSPTARLSYRAMVSRHTNHPQPPIIRRLAAPLAIPFSLRTGKKTGNFENLTLLRDVTPSPLIATVTKSIIGASGVLSTFGCFLVLVVSGRGSETVIVVASVSACRELARRKQTKVRAPPALLASFALGRSASRNKTVPAASRPLPGGKLTRLWRRPAFGPSY